MSPSTLPLISEADFPGFQRIIRELDQVSYHEWVDDHVKAVAYRRSRNGSLEIPIAPAEFDLWLKERGMSPHLELLWICAEDKAKGISQLAPALS